MKIQEIKTRFFLFFISIICILFFNAGTSLCFSTHNTLIDRTCDATSSVENEPIRVTVRFTNFEANDLRGFFYTESIPEGLNVSTITVKLDGTAISNYLFERGAEGAVYPGYYPVRWILESPTQYFQNNPIRRDSVLEIVYALNADRDGVYNLEGFSWVGYYPDGSEGQKAAFGHSEESHFVSLFFEHISTKVLTLQANGNGTTIPSLGSHDYPVDTVVDLTAIPSNGWSFVSWSGDVANPNAPSTAVVMDSSKTVTAMFSTDNDNDGMSDTEEQGPFGNDLNYDGNSDNIPDWQQENVASGSTENGHYITIAVPDPCKLSGCKFKENPNPDGAPSNVTFPYGFFNFIIHNLEVGGNVQLTIYLSNDTEPDTYWKYGATPDTPNPHWYEFNYDNATQTGAEITDRFITLHFVDAKRGDDNIVTSDGIITNQGAPAIINTDIPAIDPGNSNKSSGGSGGGCYIMSIRGIH